MTDKERSNHIIDEAYKNYLNEWTFEKYPNDGSVYSVEPIKVKVHSKEQFVYRCKTNNEFSEKWGLKIEEGELNLDERAKLHPTPEMFYEINGTFSIGDSIENSNFPDKDWLHEQFNRGGIPTKMITLTYNNETIEVYE